MKITTYDVNDECSEPSRGGVEMGTVCTMKNRVFAIATFATILICCVPVSGFVSIRERGFWPTDWPDLLESYRDRAKTFEIGTDVRENVYEIGFRTSEEFDLAWSAILRLRSDGAPLRVRNVVIPDDKSEGPFANDRPVVRIYTPVYGSSAQKPGGRMLPVGPPWPASVNMANGLLPEYVVISQDGMTWLPAIGEVASGFKHRARIEIELVADGEIINFDKVMVPVGTPILDYRQRYDGQIGTGWYVSPQGRPENPGSADEPWDLASAVSGRQRVTPGDTIYLLEGVYRRRPIDLFEVRLEGAPGNPILIRPARGQKVRIDGGFSVRSPSSYVIIRDLEIFVSEPLPDKPVSAGTQPRDLNRPAGGLHLYGGSDCKYINLVIHHCSQGISCWKGELNPEIYGCLLYANGWQGVDGGHGHCIYTQNDEGVKTISNCIMTCPYDGNYTVYAFGSEKAFVNNYLFTENICYGRGPFLVGGGRPSRGIRICGNWLYGVGMKIGYSAPQNEDCEIRDNVVVNGELETSRYRDVVWEDNLVIPTSDTPRTEYGKSLLLSNRYDWNRAHLAVFNWGAFGLVAVEVGGFLDEGDTAELYDPENPFGESVAKAICRRGTIHVPVRGEFTAFVVKIRRR